MTRRRLLRPPDGVEATVGPGPAANAGGREDGPSPRGGTEAPRGLAPAATRSPDAAGRPSARAPVPPRRPPRGSTASVAPRPRPTRPASPLP